jgi:hypothetical protein
MIERAYSDKRFEDANVITELSLGQRKANRHAACIVINLVSKGVQLLVNLIMSVDLEGKGLSN